MSQDRIQSDHLPLTQEFLGQMLGTRRSSVTVSAGILQKAGMISIPEAASLFWTGPNSKRQPAIAMELCSANSRIGKTRVNSSCGLFLFLPIGSSVRSLGQAETRDWQMPFNSSPAAFQLQINLALTRTPALSSALPFSSAQFISRPRAARKLFRCVFGAALRPLLPCPTAH